MFLEVLISDDPHHIGQALISLLPLGKMVQEPENRNHQVQQYSSGSQNTAQH